jgi:hypothetical protein
LRLGHPQYTRGSIGKATHEFGDECGSSPLPSGISYPGVRGEEPLNTELKEKQKPVCVTDSYYKCILL